VGEREKRNPKEEGKREKDPAWSLINGVKESCSGFRADKKEREIAR